MEGEGDRGVFSLAIYLTHVFEFSISLQSFAVMSLNYLREIENAQLPFTVTDPERIKQIELLRAALVIRATIECTPPDSHVKSAVVHEITAAGHYLFKKGVV